MPEDDPKEEPFVIRDCAGISVHPSVFFETKGLKYFLSCLDESTSHHPFL